MGLLGTNHDLGNTTTRSLALQERSANKEGRGHSTPDGRHPAGLHPILRWSLGNYPGQLHHMESSGVHLLLREYHRDSKP